MTKSAGFTGCLPSIQTLHGRVGARNVAAQSLGERKWDWISDEDKVKVRNPTNCDRAIRAALCVAGVGCVSKEQEGTRFDRTVRTEAAGFRLRTLAKTSRIIMDTTTNG